MPEQEQPEITVPAENSPTVTDEPVGSAAPSDLRSYRRHIIDLAVPASIEYMMVSLIMVVDTAVVGRLGAEALAVVGLSWALMHFFLMISLAVNQGMVAVIARYVGAGDMKTASKATGQGIIINFFLAVVATVILAFGSDFLMTFMKAEPNVKEQGIKYLHILALLPIVEALTQASNSALKSAGDTRTPMIINGTRDIINAVLVICLVFGYLGFPAMGVIGSAVATVIALVLGMIVSFGGLLLGWYRIRVGLRDILFPNWEMIGKIVRIGWPGFVENIFFAIMMLVFTRIVAGLGTIALAVFNVLIRAEAFSVLPLLGFSMAASIAAGQSLGEKNTEKARLMVWEAAKLAVMITIVMGFALVVFPEWVIKIFTTDPAVITESAAVLKFIGLFSPIAALVIVLRGALVGAGDTNYVMKISFISIWGFRIPFAYIFGILLMAGVAGVWAAIMFQMAFSAIVYYRRYLSGKWMEIKI